MVEGWLSLKRPEAHSWNHKPRAKKRTDQVCLWQDSETRMESQATHQEKVTATCMIKEEFWFKIQGGRRNRKQETKDLSGQEALWLCSQGLMRRTRVLSSPGNIRILLWHTGYTDSAKVRVNAHKEETLSLSWKASSSDKRQWDFSTMSPSYSRAAEGLSVRTQSPNNRKWDLREKRRGINPWLLLCLSLRK